ncbi:unnamed protein product, partial [Mesorhabditis belari]|uniref:Uncharacterized protein n=1 Tax=Mesorhabditis belari TaxID=2138241 RepID=A0AAF3EFU1_9BILA
MSSSLVFWIFLVVPFCFLIKNNDAASPNSSRIRKSRELINLLRENGRLRMCPPGGSSFTMAWSMACSMRRKRDVDDVIDEKTDDALIGNRDRRAFIAPSIRQLQRICCSRGCTVSDLLGYCGPLSGW